MNNGLSKNEIDAVIHLDADKRYEYSIKRIADFEVVWVLGDTQGLRTYSDSGGSIIFPVWPFKDFALLCCEGEFADCIPEKLELDDFMENYLPDFKKSGYKLTLLPLPSNKGAVIDIEAFEDKLREALEQF